MLKQIAFRKYVHFDKAAFCELPATDISEACLLREKPNNVLY